MKLLNQKLQEVAQPNHRWLLMKTAVMPHFHFSWRKLYLDERGRCGCRVYWGLKGDQTLTTLELQGKVQSVCSAVVLLSLFSYKIRPLKPYVVIQAKPDR